MLATVGSELGVEASVQITDEHCAALAKSMGYAWPSDSDGQRLVLYQMAEMASYWRDQATNGKRVKHTEARNRALAAKLRNTRTALRDFMKTQAAFVREGMEEIRSHIQPRRATSGTSNDSRATD